jgi:hypothetical protein
VWQNGCRVIDCADLSSNRNTCEEKEDCSFVLDGTQKCVGKNDPNIKSSSQLLSLLSCGSKVRVVDKMKCVWDGVCNAVDLECVDAPNIRYDCINISVKMGERRMC